MCAKICYRLVLVHCKICFDGLLSPETRFLGENGFLEFHRALVVHFVNLNNLGVRKLCFRWHSARSEGGTTMFQKMLCKAFTTTIIIGLIMSLTAVLAVADTPVGGFIRQDTTWTAADSPYEMIASVVVEENVTLTIEPNVTVKVAGQYALQVGGGLVARGTETKPIIFTTTEINPVPGSWGYIKFEDSSMDAVFDDGEYVSGSILQYCTVEYGGGSGEGAVWIASASPFIITCLLAPMTLTLPTTGGERPLK